MPLHVMPLHDILVRRMYKRTPPPKRGFVLHKREPPARHLEDESRLDFGGFSVTVKNPEMGREYLDRPPQH